MSVNPARGIVVINGQEVKWKSIQVEQNTFSAADTFEVVLPFFVRNVQGNDRVLANGANFQSVLLTQDVIPIQIYVGYPNNPSSYTTSDLTQLLDGFIDTSRWNFDKEDGEIVTCNGRNIIGQMMDKKITDKYPNLTTTAIAVKIAESHGLQGVVAGTNTLAGTFYNQNSSALSDDSSEWDLLLYLAKHENFITRVKGKLFLMGPYGIVTGPDYTDQTPLKYTWGKNIEKLEFERSPHAARDVIVNVISWDSSTQTRIQETAKATTQYAQKTNGSSREQYTENYMIPGLTRDQAQKKAQAIRDELCRCQVIGQLDVPGNPKITIDRKLTIDGVGLGLSDSYYLTKVTHTLDKDNGYGISSTFSNQFMPNEDADEKEATT